LAGSYRAGLHPTGETTKDHEAHQLAGIPSHISTLLAQNDEDVKTVQPLMRRANSTITITITVNIRTPSSGDSRRPRLSACSGSATFTLYYGAGLPALLEKYSTSARMLGQTRGGDRRRAV
jgi:hypothetical protein